MFRRSLTKYVKRRSDVPVASTLISVESLIESPDKSCHRNAEGLADSQKRGNGNRPSGLDLLPVPRGESVRDHVFLRVPALLPQVADASA